MNPTLVLIYSGDRTFVRQEWPSPSQFNHMIIAIQVSDGTTAPTVVQLPSLGRFLVFDPTSETTPMGDLPWYEQGSFAALIAGDKGAILKMPLTNPEANGTDLTIAAELTGSGALKALCDFVESGQSADKGRAQRLYRSPDEYRQSVQEFFSQRVKGVAISKLDADRFDENRFRLSVELNLPLYGQLMQGRLLVFNPSVIEPAHPMFPMNATRTEPIILRLKVTGNTFTLSCRTDLLLTKCLCQLSNVQLGGSFSLYLGRNQGK